MWTDEGTDRQTEKKEGYTDSHADGRTPFKKTGSFRDYEKAPKNNFHCTGIRICTPLHSIMTGVNRPAYGQSEALVSFLLQDGKNTGVLPYRTSQCGLEKKRNKMVQISLAGRL